MGVRLNKVLTELNIGFQTAVDFLKNKSSLGEIRDDFSANSKITDQQYEALVAQFKGDKFVKTEAGKILAKKSKGDKKQPAKGEALLEERQHYTPLGKMDLDAVGKKPKPTSAPQDNKPAQKTSTEKPVSAEKPAPAVDETPKVKETEAVKETPKSEKVVKNDSKAEAAQPVVADKTSQPVQNKDNRKDKKRDRSGNGEQRSVEFVQKENSDIYALKSEVDRGPKLNVLGKIDLSTINQSTRPKKKSKEERRKEREEKAQGERRRRQRVSGERVDIEAVSKQGGNGKKKSNSGGGQHPNNANNQQAQQNGSGKKKKNRNKPVQKPVEVSDEDVARQVKETLARLTNKSNANKKGAKYRKEKREAVADRMNEERMEQAAESKVLKLTEFVTVSELATMMNVPVNKVIGTLMSIGVMVSINQRLDAETINMVAEEFGFGTEYVSAEVSAAVSEDEDDENDLLSRAPVVTVMGHVDHGKTSLLDYIRNTNVIAGEAGGITQHIGAYNVGLKDGRRICFLDTPGHEAFTAMRARGTQVTDIAIIIIAADDSVMPTTKEAIAHAQAANVPMVFAINKIDKPGANPDKIREDLAQMNLLVEEWGGKYQCQEISAKKGVGVEDLLEKVLLEAEMLDLKANPNRKATGSIIESQLDKGRGYVSTVLVSNGTLKVGDIVLAGTSWGRIKAMFNERNQRITEAGPAEPASILGLNGAPTAGDSFHVMESDQEAKEIANKREQLQREQGLRTQQRMGLADLARRIAKGVKELNIIVKGDTDGSIEALSDSFIKLSTEKIQVNVIQKSVGQISENDVTLASVSDAIIVAFQVRPSAAARKLAEQEGVEINTYSVIYDAIDDVTHAMEGMLDKIKKEVATGQVEVREVYRISKVGTVAGAIVTEGKIHRSDKARLVRDGIVIHTGDINALKRYKDDVKEVPTNMECGISLVNYNDIQQGDIIETFTVVEIEQKL